MEINFIFHPLKEQWIVEWEGNQKVFGLKGKQEAEDFIKTLKPDEPKKIA